MAGWASLQELVKEEINQRREEGCRVAGFDKEWELAGTDESKLMQVYDGLQRLEIAADFPYTEPNDLQGIRRGRPSGPRKLDANLTEEQWKDKFRGAWLGRCAGCALGKPLETWDFMYGKNGSKGWRNIKLWFEGADAWPIANYTSGHSRAREEHKLEVRNCLSLRESIAFMESDDDLRYTVLGLIMLGAKGAEWETWDVGKLWHSKLAYAQVCTAETQAYKNFADITSHTRGKKPDNWEHKLEWVRTYLNPYREWIGAQIRVDGYAYGAAGYPELAAEFAWRDASFSHVKNGIYGAMFVAAMIAAAFVETEPLRIVEIGLSEIPSNSRLAHDIRQAVRIAKHTTDQVELISRLWDAFGHYNPVHTNNNAALCAATLIFAGTDYEKAITTAVLGGWDTDCNGATVGSIVGAMVGAGGIPDKWAKPLNDTLYAEIVGYDPIAISACGLKSFEVFAKLRGMHGNS